MIDSITTSNGTRVLTLLRGRSAVFAVLANSTFIVVDTSTKQNRKRLFEQVDALIDQGNLLAGLVLTHTHFDHSQNAAAFQARYHVPLFCNEAEADALKEGRSPEVRGAVAPLRFITTTFASLLQQKERYEPVTDVCTFDDTLDLKDIGIPAQILHTPGHTPGSSSLVVAEEVVLAGDTIFGIVPHRVFPPFVVDTALLYKSWLRLIACGCKVFLPSHGSARNIDEFKAGIARLKTSLQAKA